MLVLFIVIVISLPLSLADTSEAATYLMCDPVERLVEVQVCDYSNSAYGGICFYELRQRPFRTNSTDLRSLSGVTPISLPSNKERELLAFVGNRIANVEHRPVFEYGRQPVSQLVPPYQRFRLHQNMILCGPYAVPTPEVVPAFDVPAVDRWMTHPPSKKQFYFSSEGAAHSVAKRKCEEMHGRLALLNNAGQFNFAGSIAVLRDPPAVTESGWWTGAKEFNASDITVLQWAQGRPQYAVATYPRVGATGCVVTLFHLRSFTSVGCETSYLRYVCEKN